MADIDLKGKKIFKLTITSCLPFVKRITSSFVASFVCVRNQVKKKGKKKRKGKKKKKKEIAEARENSGKRPENVEHGAVHVPAGDEIRLLDLSKTAVPRDICCPGVK